MKGQLMPLYEYQCESWCHRFERIQKFSDPPLTVCPNCGGPVRKLLSSPAIQFKGSGFYITDYAKSGKGSEGGSDKSDAGSSASAEKSGEKSGSSDSASKSDSTSTTAESSSPGSSKPAESAKADTKKTSDKA
jgi:putative FmdB family regulatory protein